MNEGESQEILALSVVVPCHNPRRGYLERAMTALRGQTLPQAKWELCVVDNASEPPLSEWLDASWHENGRIVHEPTLGLTAARLRGFAETTAPWIVMVDDDNVLDAFYLERALQIANQHPILGAFGGSIEPVFDAPPPAWTRPYWERLAIRPVSRSVWSNDINHWESTPCGAGMCVKRDVARHYAGQMEHDPLRRSLDRTGERLISGGDMDLAWTACAMGLGMGCFCELHVSHLIPPERLTKAYLLRMFEGNGYSGSVLNSIWRRDDPESTYDGVVNLFKAGLRRLMANWRARQFLAARRRGELAARAMLSGMEHSVPAGKSASRFDSPVAGRQK